MLLTGMEYKDKSGQTKNSRLNARRVYLQRMRRILEWSFEETAKRLGILPSEYIVYEEGRSLSLSNDITFEEIEYYMQAHIKELGLDGPINIEREEKR
jgi:hypothetical protein